MNWGDLRQWFATPTDLLLAAVFMGGAAYAEAEYDVVRGDDFGPVEMSILGGMLGLAGKTGLVNAPMDRRRRQIEARDERAKREKAEEDERRAEAIIRDAVKDNIATMEEAYLDRMTTELGRAIADLNQDLELAATGADLAALLNKSRRLRDSMT